LALQALLVPLAHQAPLGLKENLDQLDQLVPLDLLDLLDLLDPMAQQVLLEPLDHLI
jgi:hypothetical protein